MQFKTILIGAMLATALSGCSNNAQQAAEDAAAKAKAAADEIGRAHV